MQSASSPTLKHDLRAKLIIRLKTEQWVWLHEQGAVAIQLRTGPDPWLRGDGSQDTASHPGVAGKVDDGNTLQPQPPGSERVEGIVIREILYAGRGTKEDNRTQIGEWWEIC
jgi:hypothetical protein